MLLPVINDYSSALRDTSTDAASSGEDHVSIKNSFIHVPEVGDQSAKLRRPRVNSAPCLTTSEESNPPPPVPVVAVTPCSGLPTTSPATLAEDGRIIEFRGDIFYTVFFSPVCERSPAKLPPGTTTVMIRNIPTRFTSVSFLRILDDCGFRGAFDFFYLPMDFRTGKNMGYCFLNFIHFNYTIMFASLFHGRRLRMTTSIKVIEISPSRRQGLLANVALFKDSDLLGSLSLPHFKPLVLVGGSLRPLSDRTYAAVFKGADGAEKFNEN